LAAEKREKKLIFYAFLLFRRRSKISRRGKKHKSVCIWQSKKAFGEKTKSRSRQPIFLIKITRQNKTENCLFSARMVFMLREMFKEEEGERCGIKCNKRDQIVTDCDEVKVLGEEQERLEVECSGNQMSIIAPLKNLCMQNRVKIANFQKLSR
jgi:hypothetical protein